MIAVADASPICYLILIGEAEIPPTLFDRVLLPTAVSAELLDQGAPPAVRAWAAALPAWVTIQDAPAVTTSGLEHLHAGERARVSPRPEEVVAQSAA